MLFSAFDAADWTTLDMVFAQGEGISCKVDIASSTCWPFTKSIIGLSLLQDAPICLAVAFTSGILSYPASPF